jgi:hypothetical protein
MNLWKMELFYLLRSWRGWALLAAFFLASLLSIIVGIFIERATSGFSYTDALELYTTCSIVGTLLFIGITVSALSFDGNRDSSIFLRTRFSMKQILLTKFLVYFSLFEILFFGGFVATLIVGQLLFDSSDTISFNWFLWGLLLQLIAGLFYCALMLFISSVFRGAVASVLLTLAVFIGIPLIGLTLVTVELLMRGLIETPPMEWERISYVAKALSWWPASLSDTQAFFSVTQSDIGSGMVNLLGQSFELDAHFRRNALISCIVSSPILALIAWRRYSRREI